MSRLTRLAIALTMFAISVPAARTAAGTFVGKGLRASTMQASTDLYACLDRLSSVSVLFLIDESGSLRTTDPANRRVDAMQAALKAFEALRKASQERRDRPIKVSAAFAGFGTDFVWRADWTEVTSQTMPGLLAEAAEYGPRNRERLTNYVAALNGARTELARRVAALNHRTCVAVLFVTDGRLDLGSPSADAAGKQELCDAGGVVDALRSNGVHLLATGLSADSDPIAPEELAFLEAIAIGEAGGVTCGTAPIPLAGARGRFVGVNDVTRLVEELYGVVNEIGGGTRLGRSRLVPVCPRARCESGTVPFNIDAGLQAFNVLAQTGSRGIALELRNPGGDHIVIEADREREGSAQLGSTTVQWSWIAGETVALKARLDPNKSDSVGPWLLIFIDRTGVNVDVQGRAQVFVFGDVEPFLVRPSTVRRGASTQVIVGIRRVRGTPTIKNVFREISATVTLTDPTGTSRLFPVTVRLTPTYPSVDRLVGTIRIPKSLESSVLNISIALEPITDSGVALAPVVKTRAIRVANPASYPTVAPITLRLSSVSGNGRAEGQLRITGGSAAGCVALESHRFQQLPPKVEEVRVRITPAELDGDQCFRLAPGERRHVTVTAVPDTASDGAVRGSLRFALRSEVEPTPLNLLVPVEFNMTRPVDAERRASVFLALLLAGVGAPLIVLTVINRQLARFRDARELQQAKIAVEIDGHGIVRDQQPLARLLTIEDFENVPTDRPSRHFRETELGLEFRARSSLLKAPWGEVVSVNPIVTSAARSVIKWEGGIAPISLGLGGSWILTWRDPGMTAGTPAGGGAVTEDLGCLSSAATSERNELLEPLQVELLAFVSREHFNEQVTRIERECREALAEIAEEYQIRMEMRRPQGAGEDSKLVTSGGLPPSLID